MFKNEDFGFEIFEKGQILRPFSGVALSKYIGKNMFFLGLNQSSSQWSGLPVSATFINLFTLNIADLGRIFGAHGIYISWYLRTCAARVKENGSFWRRNNNPIFDCSSI